jgi:hypothetical protein
VFPIHTPQYVRAFGSPSCVQGLDSRTMTRAKSTRKSKSDRSVYQCFDEVFVRKLEEMGWNRDHGVLELMPIVVGFL